MADPSPAGARDRALFAILKVTGLRRAEVAALKLEDYDRGTGSIRIDGKRRKVGSIPFEDSGALHALRAGILAISHSRLTLDTVSTSLGKCGQPGPWLSLPPAA